eukprot:SAG22_NODE_101_length_20519_cov_15.588002_3_plen_55_part_00
MRKTAQAGGAPQSVSWLRALYSRFASSSLVLPQALAQASQRPSTKLVSVFSSAS